MNRFISTTCAINAHNKDCGSRLGVADQSVTKRAISPLVWLLFLFVFIAQTAKAQDEFFPTGNGEGTADKPYQIITAAELAQLATLVNASAESEDSYHTAHYKLMNNIDLDAFSFEQGWMPIGVDANNSFKGVFDGDGKTITGLFINRPAVNNQGLFGHVTLAEIKNLGVTGANVRGATGVGILTGYTLGGIFDNCFSEGEVSGTNSAGGLIGQPFFYDPTPAPEIGGEVSPEITNCYSTAKVSGTGNFMGGLVGLIQGFNYDVPALLENCYATGDVQGGANSGGLAGTAPNVIIRSCFATGTYNGGTNSGGLVGRFDGPLMENCFATGNVTGTATNIGGLVGLLRSLNVSVTAVVKNCYALGDVNLTITTGNVGGIAGSLLDANHRARIENCIALNPGVRGGGTARRVIGNSQGAAATTLVNNRAWNGIPGTWTSAADGTSGLSMSAAEIRAEGFLESLFESEDDVWTFAAGKLPGLNGATVDMPSHLLLRAQSPTIITQPTGSRIVKGNTYTFIVEVEEPADGGTLSYQWFRKADSDEEAIIIGEATTVSYTTPVIPESGMFYYHVEVTNTNDDDELDVKKTTIKSSVATLEVTDQPIHEVTLVGGTGASGAGIYVVGEVVNISAGTEAGKQFMNWTADKQSVIFDDANSTTTTFIMPDEAVVVTANFGTLYEVKLSGVGVGATGAGSYFDGVRVDVSAGTQPGKQFVNWTADKPSVIFNDANSPATFFTMPAENVEVTANFEVQTNLTGSGTEGDPYQIRTAAELALLATFVNASSYSGDAYHTAHYKLMNDIDLGEYTSDAGWITIGVDANNSFKGVFDGNGKVITGLYINRAAANQGLFGHTTTAEIKNLGVTGANVRGTSQTGILAGAALGSNITNCYSSGEVNGTAQVGGLFGQLFQFNNAIICTITGCHSTAKVTGTGDHVGGLIGLFQGIDGNNHALSNLMTDCYATGDVTAGNYGGGIAGTTPASRIVSSYATGTVRGGTAMGGLVGRFDGPLAENCFATGNVSGTASNVGGLIGLVRSSAGVIKNCYAMGAVQLSITTGAVGGIAGGLFDGNIRITIENCVALNPSVRGGQFNQRIIGSSFSTTATTLIDNMGWDGMIGTAGNSTSWGGVSLSGVSGASMSNHQLKTTVFPTYFAAAPWTYIEDRLPGLLGQTLEMPNYLKIKSFALDADDVYAFEMQEPGFETAPTLTVTVTNNMESQIGPLNITLEGANADDFTVSSTTITSIAQDATAQFTVSPKTGLEKGYYTATVKVTNEIDDFYVNFDVTLLVSVEGDTGTPDVSWYDGGKDVFEIGFSDQLAGLAQLVNSGTNFSGKTVRLIDDIDLFVYKIKGWTPIGNSSANSFQGTFDGGNHAITELYAATAANFQGLFGYTLNAEIKNLSIIDAYVRGNTNCGILVGQADVTKIDNCFTSGEAWNNSNFSTVGGMVGALFHAGGKSSAISNSHSTATVNTYFNNGAYIGGLVGLMQGVNADEPAIMTNCYATGNVTGGGAATGGLIGVAAGIVHISSSYATGAVAGQLSTTTALGGLVGRYDGGRLENCFATGSVRGVIRVGGLVGEIRGSTAVINNCYATGEVTGRITGAGTTDGTGGIVGGVANLATESATVTNSIALNSRVTGAEGLTGRVVGNPTNITLFDNLAWRDMLNAENTTIWYESGSDNKNGLNRTIDEIRANGFFEDVFEDENDVWTFASNRLPGLNGSVVNIPSHLALQAQQPIITTPPSGSTITLGSTHTFTVVAAQPADGGTLSYQWYSKTNEVENMISGATSNSYTTPGMATIGNFFFYVVVTNTIDSDAEVDVKTSETTSDVVTLVVTSLPTYEVTLNAGTGAIGAGTYLEGQRVDITVGTIAGKRFVNWTADKLSVNFNDVNNPTTYFTMPAEAVVVTAIFEDIPPVVTLNVHKDGAPWSAHSKTFRLKLSTDEIVIAMTGSNSVLTAIVSNGTWKVYEGETDTGVTIVISNNADGSVTVNYYTITYRAVNSGAAMGSTISATYAGNNIVTETVVLSGKTLEITAVGAEPNKFRYTFEWGGTASGTEATYTTVVNALVNAVCTVTGNRITSADELLANPLKAWVNDGTLYVSGFVERKAWKLYNVSGTLVKQGIADSDVTTISLNLPGVYIIQSEGYTLKIVFN